MTLRPSVSWTVAETGQTTSHGACSQCMHGIGWKKVSLGASGSPLYQVSTLIQCIWRLRRTSSLPTTAMLFSAWQAVLQALQPMQELRLIAIAQAFRLYSYGG